MHECVRLCCTYTDFGHNNLSLLETPHPDACVPAVIGMMGTVMWVPSFHLTLSRSNFTTGRKMNVQGNLCPILYFPLAENYFVWCT